MMSPDIWGDLIQLIYIMPMLLAFLARLLWWIYLSEPGDAFWPDPDGWYQPFMLCLTFWPLIAVCVIGCFVMFIIWWPFWYAAKSIRNWRINRSGSIQNVSGVTCGQEQQQRQQQ